MDQNLYGYWKMTVIRFLKDDGTWESEEVVGGASIFTESGYINTFTRTSELSFGYSGMFTIKGNDLIITPEVCSIQEREGGLFIRTVKSVSRDALTLGMVDDATGRSYEMDFIPLARSFVASH